MSVEKIQRDITNLFNYPSDPNPTTQQDYIAAVKNWVGNVINLVDIGLWQPETTYAVGTIVRTPSLPVFALKCITAGTSDVTEPDYTDVSEGDTIQDNNVEWTVCTINTENSDSKANVNASNIGVNAEIDNSELWGSAIGGGEIAEDDGKLVTGGTVHAVTSVLASDIADNTDDIAQNTTDIGIADKRISNIEKLLQGNLYDYQTDNSSAYTKSVPAGAMPYAGLEKVGGKTVVWNQLQANTQTRTNGGVVFTFNSTTGELTVSEETPGATRTSTAYWLDSNSLKWNWIAGHKYLIRVHGSIPNVLVSTNWYISYPKDTLYGQNIFYTNPVDRNACLQLQVKTTDDIPTPVTFKPQVFDLTLIYGAGNEPTTVEEFEAMFPADYYEYNAGTLLSAGVTEVISKDANNATLQTITVPTAIRNLEGYGWSAGTAYNYVDFERKVFVQNVGAVDLGTLNWIKDNNIHRFNYDVALAGAKRPSSNDVRASILCALYLTIIASNQIDMSVAMNTSGYLRVYDNNKYTNITPAEFKTAMSGVYMYYELETPIETDISEYLTDDNLINVEAGGTLTFPNSNGDDYRLPVPSEEEYMIDLQSAL